jgi:hypothetical protein
MKYLRKTVHLYLSHFRQISLPINELRCCIRFRTPRKIKKSKNLLKWNESSYPKAGFLERKMVSKAILPVSITQLRTGRRTGSHRYPERTPYWIT